MTQDVILHAHSTGPNPYKVAILLEELGLKYKVKVWQFGDGESGVKGPIYTKINENGRVPAIEDPNTGVVAWESLACTNYLLRHYDQSNKFGPGSSPQEIIDFDKWSAFLLSTLGPMQGQLNWYRHYNGTENKNALERYEAQTLRCYDVLEGQLKKSGGKSVLEKGYSAVDMHFYPWVQTYGYAGLSVDKYPMIQKWLGEVKGREAVKKAYEAIGKGEEQ